jgi:hypothetical protein
VKEIGKIKSVLTMVGGKVVYAAPPFAEGALVRGCSCEGGSKRSVPTIIGDGA